MNFDAYVEVPDFWRIQELFNKILNSDVKLERLAQVPGLYSWMDLVMALSDTESVLEKDELAHLKETNNLLVRCLPGLVQKGFIRQTIRPSIIDGRTEYNHYFELPSIVKISQDDMVVWSDYLIRDSHPNSAKDTDCFAVLELLNLRHGQSYSLGEMHEKVRNVGISIALFCGILIPELCKKGYLIVLIDNSGENEPEVRYQLANIG